MLHFQPFSEENLTPKRAVFDHTGPRSRRERLGASVENQSHELQESLKDLGIQVTEEQTRESLENLRSGVDLQQAAQEQESREVNELIRLADQERGLEQVEVRERFMSDVQQRLAVVLAMLVNDGELTEAQLTPANISATLAQLETNKAALKVSASAGERNLYAHEQGLLGMTSKLSQHANAEVKEAWENMTKHLANNVRLMRVAAAAISSSENETSWSDEAQEMFDTVKEQWGKLSPTTKGLAIAGGA